VNLVQQYVIFDPEDEARFKAAMKNLPREGEHSSTSRIVFNFIRHFFTSLLVAGFAIVLGLMEKLKQNEKKQKEMEKEKLHSELAFLKNQISPHFFFNTLNNIYSLIGIDGPTAQESVLKLSKMMRYLLYESERGETMMSHEIEFMNNYIDLMKLRQSKRVDLQVDFPGNFSDFPIPPLLFIPFIENAFKHGVSHREESVIKIRMEIDQDQICFFTVNGISKSPQTGDMQQHSGIGLDNVKKRLGLLFPGKHELQIENDQTHFKVRLRIQK
jgi:LytS/YehU family sensor histidine kinase